MPLISKIGSAASRGFGLFGAIARVIDPFFEYVALLLHGDGTNGAQNNTFLDSSTNNFTVTRNGTPTQGSYSPYGPNWSNYFNGSSNSFSVPANTAFAFGQGDLTVQMWVYPTATITSPANIGLFYIDQTNGLVVGLSNGYIAVGQRAIGYDLTSTYIPPLNTWTHIAATRSGPTAYIFANGTLVGTVTASGGNPANNANYVCTTGLPTIAGNYGGGTGFNYFPGYISNVQVVKGTAVYTSAFTPPTTPLTAISGTSLLTCQSNRFIDNSSNAFAITLNGTPSIQIFSPFNPPNAYNTSTIGGSGYFNGSSDYLSIATAAPLVLSGGVWTIECWCYFTSNDFSTYRVAINKRAGGAAASYDIYFNVTSGYFAFYNGTAYTSSTAPIINAWNHIAVVYDGTNINLYMNGVRVLSTATTNPDNGGDLFIGADVNGTSSFYLGYISNVRILKGTALYSGTTYTVPTAPLTAITNTSLLLNYTNAGIYDNAMMNDLTTVGSAQVSTTQVKFGSGSISFGTGSYLNTRSLQIYGFGTGDFTIETWIYITSIPSDTPIFDGRDGVGTAVKPCVFYSTASGGFIYYVNGAIRIAGGTVTLNTWQYFALVRSNGSTKMYLNSTQIGSTYTDSNSYVACSLRIGYFNDGTTALSYNGYMDDFRVTSGYARTITTPTAAFPNQ